ncbi:hypothetical protein ATL41_2241 [Flavimobilis soli]|uniref:Uncharacterized protein n=1 Tax=Flavimobilis soli TaxID=442709 RepID=A0A2A9EEJ9_9MICO|nr:hypothetical protein [Flavimobilis soli]PFG37477.1 hypothetical protein ATL41_2241 [Flavimobilis soli]
MEPIPGGAGILALVGLWVAYLLPQRTRHRDQLLEARSDDRFSGSMRILAVARPARALGDENRECRPGQTKHDQLLTGSMPTVSAGQITGRAKGAQDMDRPTTGAQRTVSPAGRTRPVSARPMTPRSSDAAREAAAQRARRAAIAEQRAAAAKRRLALTLTLLSASAIAWTAVSAFTIPVVIPSVLTAMLAGVLVLGRRAVVAGRRADAAAAAQARSGAAPAKTRPSVTGRAVHASDVSTQMISSDAVRAVVAQSFEEAQSSEEAQSTEKAVTVESTASEPVASGAEVAVSEAEESAPAAKATEATPAPATVVEEGGELAGFSLPRPTYTMKAAAPRREPAPLDDADVTTPSNASERASSASASSAEESEAVSTEGLGLDLDAILARRRASGE